MWQRNGWLLVTALLLLTGFDCIGTSRTITGDRQAMAANPTNLAPVAQALTSGPLTLALQYRALGPGTDRNYLRSFWGFGTTEQAESDFTKAIDPGEDSIVYVQNSRLGAASWCALQYRDSEPVAFYIDLNGDGELSDDEILKPQKGEDWGTSVWDFITPDFIIPTGDNGARPYRYLIRVQFYSDNRPNCMWASLCAWEGEFQVGDANYAFILLDGNLNGDFQEFGQDYYALNQITDGQSGMNSQTLSRLLPIGDLYANLSIQNQPASKDEPMEVVLTKDTSPQGSLELAVAGLDSEDAELQTMRIVDADDSAIVFMLQRSSQASLPARRYQLQRANLTLSKDDRFWNMSISGGPTFAVSPDRPARIVMGDPNLAVTARQEKDRYRPDIQDDLTTCKVGEDVYLSRVVTGQAGETYGQVAVSGDEYKRHEPQVRIVNADGEEIATGAMEYG